MEGNKNISEELRLVSELLASISRLTPYELPEGYFKGLADSILARIRAGESLPMLEWNSSGIPEFLGSARSEPAYSIPEGYFEGFAGKLMDRIKAGHTLTSGPRQENAPVSEDQTADSPWNELASLSPLLSRIDRKMPFTVPVGYFDGLAATITDGLAGARSANTVPLSGQAETENLSRLLSGLKDKQVYLTPIGYFESFPATVLTAVKEAVKEQDFANRPAVVRQQPETAKVVSFNRARTWWKYSAAAVVAGLVLTGGWLWTHPSVRMGAGTASAEIARTLPTVSDQDIENYLDTNNVTNNIPLADDLANSTASLDISDNDIKSFLGDVPDGELKQYIDDHGDVKNLATN